MKCVKCGNENVTINMVQESSKARTRSTGCLWSLGRLMLICFTCGLWLLVGKRKLTSKIKHKNVKYAVCQNCGHSWKI